MMEGQARKMRGRKKERKKSQRRSSLAPQGELSREENLAALLYTPQLGVSGTEILISPTLRSRGHYGCL